MKGKRSADRSQQIRKWLLTGELDSCDTKGARHLFRQQAKQYHLQGGELFLKKGGRQRRVVESMEERKQLLSSFHTQEGHSGIKATCKKITASFFWENMKDDVITFISTCTCQKTKYMKVEQPELQHITVSETLELMGMDLIALATTPRGNKYILTVIDYCTKAVKAFPLPSKEAEGICQCLIMLFSDWGVPKRLLSDQGREFNNKLNSDLCKEYGVERSLTAPYTPQTNGLCERVNRTIKERLTH